MVRIDTDTDTNGNGNGNMRWIRVNINGNPLWLGANSLQLIVRAAQREIEHRGATQNADDRAAYYACKRIIEGLEQPTRRHNVAA